MANQTPPAMGKHIPPIETVLEYLAFHLAKSGPENVAVAKVVLAGYADAPLSAHRVWSPVLKFAFAPAEPKPRKLLIVRSEGASHE